MEHQINQDKQLKMDLWIAVKKIKTPHGLNREDWQQDLYVWALERIDKYDKTRGSLVTWLLTLNCKRSQTRAMKRWTPVDIYNVDAIYASEDILIEILDKNNKENKNHESSNS